MASLLLGMPLSIVSLTDRDRQWFKSSVGTKGREFPRAGGPCAEVTRTQTSLYVPDMLEDERFAGGLVARSGVRFYAGAPLTTREGHTLGAMCVLDHTPRTLTAEQRRSLEDFAAMVMSQIELQHDFGRIDPSSGLPNRHQLYDQIEDQMRHAPGAPRDLVVIELADLRVVSDAVTVLGARYIDELVKVAALRIKTALGQKDGVFQVGFASLALLLDEARPWEGVVRTLTEALKEPVAPGGIPILVSAVFGVSPFTLDAARPRDVLRTAISAAHDARQADLEHAVYSVERDEVHRRRFHLLTHVRESLVAERDFHLVFQPRLDLRTGKYGNAEALLRWTHPTLGKISPGEFIPLLEQTALARSMTQWVLGRGFEQIKALRDHGFGTRLSINICARNLEEDDFAETVAALLAKHGVPASDIELEFTESALIRHQSRVMTQLTAIRGTGIELAIDDFGTGYSSFSYLHNLPANVVKLDQSFMKQLTESAKSQSLVQSMITMAHDIGYRVVAEGVETAEVLAFLRSCGCDEIQGFYLSRPLTAEEFEEFLIVHWPEQRAAA